MLENVKKLCRERGVSLQEVGRACGFGTKSIYTWADKTPASIERVKRIADYFGVTVDDLLADADTGAKTARDSARCATEQ